MAWSPRSLDITPMEFFLWGHIKVSIYMSPVNSEEDLIACITGAATSIRQQPDIFESSHQSLLHHSRLSIDVSGHTFAHLL